MKHDPETGTKCERCSRAIAKYLVTVRAAVELKNVRLCTACRNRIIGKYRESESQEIAAR